MGPIRLCHLSLGLTTGGLERLLVDFARLHDRSVVHPTFVALAGGGEPARDIRATGATVVEWAGGKGGRLARIRRLLKVFGELRPDVIHTHNPAPQIWGTLAARPTRVRALVHTRHGHNLGPLARPLTALLARMADTVVCVSDELLRDLRRRLTLPGTRLARIWNGIDTERFAFGGPGQDPVAIAVSRLSPGKDVATLLRSAALVATECPSFRLRIAGDGPDRQALEKLAVELAISRHVDFLGERRDVPALLARAGFFVSSSLTEGLPLTLIEAMSVGLPVVATAVGGNTEVVTEGTTGHLVPPRDPRALASAILRLCSTPEEWPSMGRAGRDRVLADFDARRMVRDYEDLYRALL